MIIQVVACVEDRQLIDEQIAKQTLQPDIVTVLVDHEPAQGIELRRTRIAENQKLLQRLVINAEPDLVWQLEGDSVVEADTLERLVAHYKNSPAIYSGIQIGRHGLYCIGAWHINHTETVMESIDHKLTGLQRVSGMGLYCCLMSADDFTNARCYWEGERWGPDVNFFRSIRRDKYVDMDMHVGHYYKGGIIKPSDAATCNARFTLLKGIWEFEQL